MIVDQDGKNFPGMTELDIMYALVYDSLPFSWYDLDDLKNADTFEDDCHNDDTFGASAETDASAALPNFFQHHGTTVLEELGQLGDEDPDDDIMYEAEAFGTGLSDFFNPGYNEVSHTVYDSWMGGATVDSNLSTAIEDDDALERELEQAHRELEKFALDPTMLDEPYQSSSVTISLPAAASGDSAAPVVKNQPVSDNKGRHITGEDLNSLLSGKGFSSKSNPSLYGQGMNILLCHCNYLQIDVFGLCRCTSCGFVIKPKYRSPSLSK